MRSMIITTARGLRNTAPFMMMIKRAVLLFLLLDLVWRWYSHLLPHQLEESSLTKVLYNPIAHLYMLSGLQEGIVHRPFMAGLFTFLLFVCGFFSFLFPAKKLFTLPFFILFFIYGIIFPVNLAFGAHYMAAPLVVSFILLFNNRPEFEIAWDGLRYYTCWVYASAFIWKLLNGAFFQWNNGIYVMKANMGTYLQANPDTVMAGVYGFFLRNPYLVNLGAYFSFFLEAFFMLGFFTKKFDYLFIMAIILIHLLLYLFVDTLFVESYIFTFVFIPVSCWSRWKSRFSLMNY